MEVMEDIPMNGVPKDPSPTTSSDPRSSELDVQNQPSEEAKAVISYEEDFWKKDQPAGAVCYVLPCDWWNRWCSYTGFRLEDKHTTAIQEVDDAQRPQRPGPVDTGPLAGCESNEAHLREGVDFTFKSPQTWQLIERLYPGSGPPLQRSLLPGNKAMFHERPFKVRRSSQATASAVDFKAPRDGTVAELKEAACAALGVAPADTQLWDYYQGDYYSAGPVDDSEAALGKQWSSFNLIDGQDLILLEKDSDGKFPTPKKKEAPSLFNSNSSSFFGGGSSYKNTITTGTGTRVGAAGLGNLGNTCFMNSSVQCLAHTIPLIRVFLSEAYKADLNRDNPLGNKGELAEAFGDLVSKMYQAGVKSVSPRLFKHQLQKFHSHFAGYNQHDSQELLAFLLDGLHEDLNRVKNKPYIEYPDSNGRPDEELAAEAWQNYRARNDSFIADHFQGMYKSTLVCPDCHFSSVTMDTFNCLSLPLPAAKMRTLEVTVVYMDGSSPPTKYALEVLKLGTVGDLYKALARVCNVEEDPPSALLLLVEIYGGKIHRKYTEMSELLAEQIRSNDTLLAYKYPSRETGPISGGTEFHVFQRRPSKRSGFYAAWNKGRETHELFAAPLLLWLPEEYTAVGPKGAAEKLLDPQGPLGAAVESALRPFKRKRLASNGRGEGRKATTTLDFDAASSPSAEPVSFKAGLDVAAAQQAAEARMFGSQENAEPSDAAASSRRAQSTADANEMEVDDPVPSCGPPQPPGSPTEAISVSPQGTPQNSPTAAAAMGLGGFQHTPPGSPQQAPTLPCTPPAGGSPHPPSLPRKAGLEAAHHSSGSMATSPTAQHLHDVAFDMFAKQQAPSDPEDEPEGAPSTDSPPYSIRAATHLGEAGQLRLEDGQLFFAIDWAAGAHTQYNPDCIEQPQVHESVRQAKRRREEGPKPYNLDECIDAFLEGERLEDSESWSCKRCKQMVQAHKKLDLWSLPEVLVIHLKRFSYSHRFRDKIDALVNFPLRGLDLSHATLKKQDVVPLYDLYAVSNHFGGLGGGHYTAYCKLNDDGGQWYCFDDSHTYTVEESKVLSDAAYVLFYRRRTEAQEDAGKSVAELVAASRGSDTSGALPSLEAAPLEEAEDTEWEPAVDVPSYPLTSSDLHSGGGLLIPNAHPADPDTDTDLLSSGGAGSHSSKEDLGDHDMGFEATEQDF